MGPCSEILMAAEYGLRCQCSFKVLFPLENISYVVREENLFVNSQLLPTIRFN